MVWKLVSFHSHTNPVFGQALVHSVNKKCSLCNCGINLIAALEYTFFQLCSNAEKILRFRRFRRSYVNHPAPYFFKWICFKFHLIAVLICYLYFIISECIMSLEHCSGVFSGHVYCGLPWTWEEMRAGLLQKHHALCYGVLMCIFFSRS